MTNSQIKSAAEVRKAHREQCFDAVRRALGLGDTKGDTGLWLDWIDAVAPGHTADEVITLTLEQLRREYGTTATMNPPVNWTAAGWRKSRPTFTPGPWTVEPSDSGDPSVGMAPTPPVVFTTIPNREDRSIEIAVIGSTTYDNSEDGHPCYWGDPDANARLIAAAPDLLEVARYIVACYDQQVALIQRPGDQADINRLVGTIAGCHVNIGINVDAFMDNIRRAVAKAEGR